MEEKKYILLTDRFIERDGKKLYRIQAIRDFGNIKKGQIGGFIESEYNLSHYGNCWVWDNANVLGDAKVRDDANV
ncbi:MAG: hypothetical protein Q4E59_00575, partial [Bacteroidales bacterium]|nr:hypothetical protein [Bacteroidales bacterium]